MHQASKGSGEDYALDALLELEKVAGFFVFVVVDVVLNIFAYNYCRFMQSNSHLQEIL